MSSNRSAIRAIRNQFKGGESFENETRCDCCWKPASVAVFRFTDGRQQRICSSCLAAGQAAIYAVIMEEFKP